jgi:hypothetical protein
MSNNITNLQNHGNNDTILIELLDRPAQMRQFHQASQRSIGRQATEKPLGLAFFSWQRTLCKQLAFRPSPTVPWLSL